MSSGIAADKWCQHFDTVSVCFSKGLGAPVVSALCGPKDLIAKARRVRKPLGGGWRQAGILAAGALYALDHNVERLAEDHANAKTIAAAVRDAPGLDLDPARVDSNIVIFRADKSHGTVADFCAKLKEHGVLMATWGKGHIRAVTHLDVTSADAQRTAEVIQQTAKC